LRSRARSSTARSFVRSAQVAIATAANEAAQAVRLAVSALDRAAQKGAIHPNNAARRQARLLKKYNAALAAAAVAAQPATAGPTARKRRGQKEEASRPGAPLAQPATKEPALSAAKGPAPRAAKGRRAGKEEPAKKKEK